MDVKGDVIEIFRYVYILLFAKMIYPERLTGKNINLKSDYVYSLPNFFGKAPNFKMQKFIRLI